MKFQYISIWCYLNSDTPIKKKEVFLISSDIRDFYYNQPGHGEKNEFCLVRADHTTKFYVDESDSKEIFETIESILLSFNEPIEQNNQED
jgi:hypothetical protein